MTRADFEALPFRTVFDFTELVILPQRRHHDSGYRCMDFVACVNGEAICRMSGCSDVLHINGIGGFGHWSPYSPEGLPKSVPPVAWSIDCLPKSGLLRLFSRHKLSTDDASYALSSFEIFAEQEERE